MPVLFVKRYSRQDARANPKVLYLFGDNADRIGMAGQAAEMRGEPNAVGVRTKWHPHNQSRAFFADGDYAACTAMIRSDLLRAEEHVRDGGIVVVPLDGLGTGLARLPECAPRINEFLRGALSRLALTELDRAITTIEAKEPK